MKISKNCPRCFRLMQNLGNISGTVKTSHPAQWEEVHVCHDCKVKMKVQCRGDMPDVPDLQAIEGYEEVTGV